MTAPWPRSAVLTATGICSARLCVRSRPQTGCQDRVVFHLLTLNSIMASLLATLAKVLLVWSIRKMYGCLRFGREPHVHFRDRGSTFSW